MTDTIVNDFIEHGEKRIFRDVDLDIFRSYQYATLTQGVPFVSLPGANLGQLAFIRSAQIYDSANLVRYYLYQKDITFMNEYCQIVILRHNQNTMQCGIKTQYTLRLHQILHII